MRPDKHYNGYRSGSAGEEAGTGLVLFAVLVVIVAFYCS